MCCDKFRTGKFYHNFMLGTCQNNKSFGENHHLQSMNIYILPPIINNRICRSVPESIMLNCSLELRGWLSRSRHSPRESFKFLTGFSVMMGCQKEQNDTRDLRTIITYIDSFSYYLQVFLFQPIIKIEITLKALHSKGPHFIKYNKNQFIENLNRSLLIGFDLI